MSASKADNNEDTEDATQKHSRPIKSCNFGHDRASSLRETELCSVWCKKLVQEKSCSRKHDKNLVQAIMRSFL